MGGHTLHQLHERSLLPVITNMLIGFGARADWSMSGKDAVIRAQLAAKHGDPFTMFIIDWQMPDMNGVEVSRQLKLLSG